MKKELNQPAQQGDTVAYYQADGVRRVGVVQESRDDKVIVRHSNGEAVVVDDIELYLLEQSQK